MHSRWEKHRTYVQENVYIDASTFSRNISHGVCLRELVARTSLLLAVRRVPLLEEASLAVLLGTVRCCVVYTCIYA